MNTKKMPALVSLTILFLFVSNLAIAQSISLPDNNLTNTKYCTWFGGYWDGDWTTSTIDAQNDTVVINGVISGISLHDAYLEVGFITDRQYNFIMNNHPTEPEDWFNQGAYMLFYEWTSGGNWSWAQIQDYQGEGSMVPLTWATSYNFKVVFKPNLGGAGGTADLYMNGVLVEKDHVYGTPQTPGWWSAYDTTGEEDYSQAHLIVQLWASVSGKTVSYSNLSAQSIPEYNPAFEIDVANHLPEKITDAHIRTGVITGETDDAKLVVSIPSGFQFSEPPGVPANTVVGDGYSEEDPSHLFTLKTTGMQNYWVMYSSIHGPVATVNVYPNDSLVYNYGDDGNLTQEFTWHLVFTLYGSLPPYGDVIQNPSSVGDYVFDATFYSEVGQTVTRYDTVTISQPSEVWVDDDYDSTTTGWGYDHFDKIQDGINAVSSSIVHVLAGMYNEQVIIDKDDLTLTGPQAGVDPGCSGFRGDEATITYAGTDPTLCIVADNAVVEGFTIEHTGVIEWESNKVGVLIGGLSQNPLDHDHSSDGNSIQYNIITGGHYNMYIMQSSHNTIQHNRFTASVKEQMYIIYRGIGEASPTRFCRNNQVLNNCFDKAGVTTLGRAICLSGFGTPYNTTDFTGTLIQANIITDSGSGGGQNTGISVSYADGTGSNPIRIKGNSIDETSDTWYNGFYVRYASHVVVDSNSFAGDDHGVIYVQSNVSNLNFTKNVITSDGVTYGYIARFYNMENLVMTGNTITVNSPATDGNVARLMNVVGSSNVISGNHILITGTLGAGVSVCRGIDLMGPSDNAQFAISDNTLEGNKVGTVGIILRGQEVGTYSLSATTQVNITGNTITQFSDKGIESGSLYAGTAVEVHHNSIVGNSNYGVSNGAGEVVNATDNWWGAYCGPYHPTTNPNGLGDEVSDNVDYEPWCDSTFTECDFSTSPPSVVWVDDGYTPLGYNDGHYWCYDAFNNIQDGIDAVADAGTVKVLDGTYAPFIVDAKSLTVEGQSQPVVTGNQTVATTYGNRNTIIFVKSSIAATLKNLDVQGPVSGTPRYGVIFQDVTGEFTHGTVSPNNVDEWTNGCAVAVWGTSNVDIKESTVRNFGKAGIFYYASSGQIVDCTVEGVVFDDSLRLTNAIEPDYGSNVDIINTEIYNSRNLHPDPAWSSIGILSYGWDVPTTVNVYDCKIHDNDYGIWTEAGSAGNSHFNFSDITSNYQYGLYNPEGVWTDANFNYWGDYSGPTLPTGGGARATSSLASAFPCVPDETMELATSSRHDSPASTENAPLGKAIAASGTGDAISDSVTYSPWLGYAVGTAPMTFHVDTTGKIQLAIDSSSANDTVKVHEGVFNENLVVNESIVLLGSGGSATTIYPDSSDIGIPNPELGPSFRGSQMVVVEAAGVLIDGFVLDGDSPTLTPPGTIDARNGIITNYSAGNWSDLTVQNCTVKNVYLRGIYASAQSANDLTGIDFNHNTVDNVDGASDQSLGIMFWGASGTIKHNTISNSAIGAMFHWYSDGSLDSNSASGCEVAFAVNSNDQASTVSGNTITDSDQGIQTISLDALATVSGNAITGCKEGIVLYGGGTGLADVVNNVVEGPEAYPAIGVYASTDISPWGMGDIFATLRKNTIKGNFYGMLFNEPDTNRTSSVSITVSGSAEDANFVYNNGSFEVLMEYCDDDINAQYNYWGRSLTSEIEEEIYHKIDQVDLGLVTFSNPILHGDVNLDGQVSIADVVYLINYLFKSGPAPSLPIVADINGDGEINVEDAVYLTNYLFKSGPPPIPPPFIGSSDVLQTPKDVIRPDPVYSPLR